MRVLHQRNSGGVKRRWRLRLLIFCTALPLFPQTMRVTVELVQVDAVVTDEKGRHVTGLQAKDFQILEDGQPQTITHFSFEETGAARSPIPVPGTGGVAAPVTAFKALERGQVRRSVVMVVDDLGLAALDIPRMRAVLTNFIDNQMQRGDVASIITASGGVGAFEQFTSDKRMLHAQVDRIHFSFGRFGTMWYDPLQQLQPGGADQANARTQLNFQRAYSLTRGSLAALGYAISGLREMPGRKAVAFFSDGFSGGASDLIESANRASVVLYTFDVRGLETFNIGAIDSVYADKTALNIRSYESLRKERFVAGQRSMALLAQGTGGIFFHDNNDLSQQVGTALDDIGNYYLLGYKPHREDFETINGHLRFHKIEVKVLRPGLHVRSRNGYMGSPDGRPPAEPFTREEQLRRALFSPFQASTFPVQLSAFYSAGNTNRKTRRRAIRLRVMTAIDAHNLTFTDTADGGKTLALDVVVGAYGPNNEQLGSTDKSFVSTLTGKQMKDILDSGLLHSLEIEVAKPGPYQIRAAVRDGNSAQTGSASTFLQIPDFDQKRIALTSVLLQDDDVNRNSALTKSGVLGAGSVVTRAFAQGAELTWQANIFGALLNKQSEKPKIDIQVNLYRGPERIFTGKPIALAIPDGEPASIYATGKIKLPDMLPAGEYQLELIAWDRLEKAKMQRTAQWSDFTLYRIR